MTGLPFSVLIVTDFSMGRQLLFERLALALEAGPGLAVQLRHARETNDRRRFDDGQRVRALCDAARAPLFVNGRIDLALALSAHLHCTGRSLTPTEARPWLAKKLISVAVHDGELERADGADFALVSPVFNPRSKPSDTRPALGPDGFARVRALLPCPAVALGGIDTETAKTLNRAPVATIGAVLHAPDPKAAARALLDLT